MAKAKGIRESLNEVRRGLGAVLEKLKTQTEPRLHIAEGLLMSAQLSVESALKHDFSLLDDKSQARKQRDEELENCLIEETWSGKGERPSVTPAPRYDAVFIEGTNELDKL